MSTPQQRIRALAESSKTSAHAFVEFWCLQRGIDRAALVAAKRSRARAELCAAVKHQFPSITCTRVGMMLGVHFSSVLSAWRKAGIHAAKVPLVVTPELRVTVARLHAAGLTARQIREETGLSHVAVWKLVNPDYEERQRQRKNEASRRSGERARAAQQKAREEIARRASRI